MLIVTGWGSTIVKALLPMLPGEEKAERAEAGWQDFPTDAQRYLFCAGLLRPKATAYQLDAEMAETFLVNCGDVIRACDRVLAENSKARICIVGSESGYSWSFDGIYAAAKAGLHAYVTAKRLQPEQQLVCIAPGMIADTKMTTGRTDQENVAARAKAHPKKRLLRSEEVAKLIHYVLYVDEGYLSGTVIRMNGGPS